MVPQPDEQVGDRVVFSVEPSTTASGSFVPSTPTPSATTQECSPKCTPSTMTATRWTPDRSAASSSPNADSVAVTKRRDTDERDVEAATRSTR